MRNLCVYRHSQPAAKVLQQIIVSFLHSCMSGNIHSIQV
nr:MAG TPA: hypothetical protein [Caudoviricetes sp.]